MTNKNEATLVFVAIIGAFGVILAACIGLIPTILPMVRPTSTPFIFFTATVAPSDTPAPETPSATFVPPTDSPTATETVPPLITDTIMPAENSTITPTFEAPSSNVDDYVGTWVNVETDPKSGKVKMVVTRMEINKTSNTTADFSVCRATQDGEMYVEPNPSQATIYDFGLVARNLLISRYADLKWSVLVQPSGEELVATVQEYDANDIILNSDIFRLQKPSLIGSITLEPCKQPPSQ